MNEKAIERKFFTFERKSVDLEASTFEGYAAGIGNKDLGNDIIDPGAFNKTIQERVAAGNVKLLDNHNGFSTRDVWGTLTEAKQVEWNGSGPNAPSHKLYAKFEVSKADPDAQIALRKISEGHLNQLSIGFQPVKYSFEKNGDSEFDDPRTAWIMGQGTRHIQEIKLWEVSVVIWAMNPEATILGNSAKSLTEFAKRVTEQGIEVPEEAIKEAILAMNTLLGKGVSPEQKDSLSRALDDVSDAVENVCSAAGKFDPIKTLIQEFEVGTGKSYADDYEDFKLYVAGCTMLPDETDNDDDCGCGKAAEIEDEAKSRSSARTPKYDGTEDVNWSTPTWEDYVNGYYKNTDATKPDGGVGDVGDAPKALKSWVANRTLLGDSSADTLSDLVVFPVVNPSNDKLNARALRAVLSGRGSQADVSNSALDSARKVARRLLKDEYGEDTSDSADVSTEGKDSADSTSGDNETVLAAISKLSEAITSLKDAMAGAGNPTEEDSKSRDAEDFEDTKEEETHTEEKEAAEDTEDISHPEHFPDEDSLAAEMELLNLLALSNNN